MWRLSVPGGRAKQGRFFGPYLPSECPVNLSSDYVGLQRLVARLYRLISLHWHIERGIYLSLFVSNSFTLIKRAARDERYNIEILKQSVYGNT